VVVLPLKREGPACDVHPGGASHGGCRPYGLGCGTGTVNAPWGVSAFRGLRQEAVPECPGIPVRRLRA
jgi:hypothetical protein